MIYRIIGYILMFDLFLAVFLTTIGVTNVSVDNNFMYLFRTMNEMIEPYDITIPKIPMLEPFKNPTWILVIINYLMYVVNALSNLINFVIVFVNFIIKILSEIVILFSAFTMWVKDFGMGTGFLA